MKRHFFITITALMAVMISSCKKDNDELDNPNGPCSVELTAKCGGVSSDHPYLNEFYIELAGTGTVTIDWGDGTVLENFQMPELKINELNEEDAGWYEDGTEYSHVYNKIGTYSVKVFGQNGTITLLAAGNAYGQPSDFSSLTLHQCSHLQYLLCSGTFNSLDISKCTQLKRLILAETPMPSIDVSRCTQLETLYTENTELTSLDVSKCTKLKYLDCGANQLTTLDVSKCAQLKELECGSNSLTSLDVSKCTQLKRLDCSENQLTSLNVSKCTQLKYLECDENQLTTLDANGCTRLERLYCHQNQLTSLDVSGCSQVKTLSCSENRLSVVAMNQIYNDLPIVGQEMGSISVDKATAGDYYIAENKGWHVQLR